MSHEDLTVVTDAAWAAFRGRLADHLAEMGDDEVLVVAYADALAEPDEPEEADEADEAEGSVPYVQVCAFGDGWLQVEAASNAYLDPSVGLDGAQESVMAGLGWRAPTDEPGFDNFHDTVEQREADRVAVLLVRTLREVYGAPHPAFLDADGLEVDPALVDLAFPVASGAGDPVTDDVVVPADSAHLQQLVDAAMTRVFPDLRHDHDGDIPIIVGQSLAFVRVLPDRPAVEVYAEIVLDPDDVGRLPLELGLLNRAHPMWKLTHVEQLVVMRHEILAVPFCADQLRHVVHRFVDEVDAIAGDLVVRVGGRRFRDPVPTADDELTVPDELEVAMTGLLELCHLGRPRAATVAGLFDHDRTEIIRQIVRIRTGRQDCDGHDVDDVLTALRKALRLVSDGEQRPVPLPPKPRSVQASLLDDGDVGEDSLDLGWPA